MIYIIGIGFLVVIALVIIYHRYDKINSINSALNKQIQDLESKIISITDDFECRILLEEKLYDIRIEDLKKTIDLLTQEREQEAKLRIEAERALAESYRKAKDVENRMERWAKIQEDNIKNSTKVMLEVSQDINNKLNRSHKFEIENSKNLISRFSQNIADLFERSLNNKKTEREIENSNKSFNNNLLQELIQEATSSFRSIDLKSGVDFFSSENFDKENIKSFNCELALINKKTLYALDFKGCSYLSDYYHTSKKITSAEETLKKNLDKYFSYINSDEYRDSIRFVLPETHSEFNNFCPTIVLQTQKDIYQIKSIHYYGKARKLNISIICFDDIIKLVS